MYTTTKGPKVGQKILNLPSGKRKHKQFPRGIQRNHTKEKLDSFRNPDKRKMTNFMKTKKVVPKI